MRRTLMPTMPVVTALLLVTGSPLFAQEPSAPHASPALLMAQQNEPASPPAAVRKTESAVEGVVRRFGIGVQGGVALDPELIDFGAHARFGPLFNPNVELRPGFEVGLGEVTTLFGINIDVLYMLPGASRTTRWAPYVGAGPNFALSHRSFDSTDDPEADESSRFDFSDTDFQGGFNFIAGVRSPGGVFLEMKATAYGVSAVRLLAGFNF